MANNENTPKTPTQKKKRYATIQWTCFFSEFLAVATPFVAIGIVNYDKYFIQYNGTKMSIAFFMALAVMGFAIWAIAKKKLENSFVTLIIGWVVAAFIFTMLGEMIADLAVIMWCGLAGIAAAYGLDVASKAAEKKKKEVIDAMKQADKDKLVEDVKAEREAKKVRVRVKK